MPFFSMVRRPRVETRSETQRRSVSSQKRCVCRLGRKRRRFLLLAWETRLPTAGLLPVISQTRDIRLTLRDFRDLASGGGPLEYPGRALYQPGEGISRHAASRHDRRIPEA